MLGPGGSILGGIRIFLSRAREYAWSANSTVWRRDRVADGCQGFMQDFLLGGGVCACEFFPGHTHFCTHFHHALIGQPHTPFYLESQTHCVHNFTSQ